MTAHGFRRTPFASRLLRKRSICDVSRLGATGGAAG